MIENTGLIRSIVNEIVNEYQIGTISDVGCGDENWIHEALPDSVEYVGYDIKPRYLDVISFDVTTQILPEPADLILCIYVMNHLQTNELRARSLRLLGESGSRYLLLTSTNKDEHLVPFTLIERWKHKDTGRHVWSYGLWRL